MLRAILTTGLVVFSVQLSAESLSHEKGLTWSVRQFDQQQNKVSVGCHTGNHRCDPYQGNALCSSRLPVLCINVTQASQSPDKYQVAYANWSGGVVAATKPVSPANRGWQSVADANAFCRSAFGDAWRMAEHHDGGHWHFSALTLKALPSEFWVHINDQKHGNCW